MVEIRNPTTLRKSTGVDATEAQGVGGDVVDKNEVVTKADLIKVEAKIERMTRLMIIWICSFIVGYSIALIAVVQLFRQIV